MWNTEGGLQLASPHRIRTVSHSRIPASRIWEVPYPWGTYIYGELIGRWVTGFHPADFDVSGLFLRPSRSE